MLIMDKTILTCEVQPCPPTSLDRVFVGKAEDELVIDKLSEGLRHESNADMQSVIRSIVLPTGHTLGEPSSPGAV